MEVKVVPIDLSNGRDYSGITDLPEVKNLSILVNNAGSGNPEKVFDLDPVILQRIHKLNIYNPVLLTKSAMQIQRGNKGSSLGIIQMSSTAADIPAPYATTTE